MKLFHAILLAAFATSSAFALPTFKSEQDLNNTLKSILDLQGGGGRAIAFAALEKAGVEEGGIFKRAGKHLVYLRKGVLYAVDASQPGKLKQTGSIWAAHPDLKKEVWVDEILVRDNTVVTISHRYSYKGLWGPIVILPADADKDKKEEVEEIDHRSFSEINTFTITADGKFEHKDHVLFEANDYFSGENYASRFVGGKLLTSSPLWFAYGKKNELRLPQIYQVEKGKLVARSNLLKHDEVFQPVLPVNGQTRLQAFHSCSIAPKLECATRSFFVNDQGEHYASPDYMYHWSDGVIYRLKLNDLSLTYHPAAGRLLNYLSMQEIDGDLHAVSNLNVFRDKEAEQSVFVFKFAADVFKDGVDAPSHELKKAGEAQQKLLPLSKQMAELSKKFDWKQRETEEQKRLQKEVEKLSKAMQVLQSEIKEALSDHHVKASAPARRKTWKNVSIIKNRFVGSNYVFAVGRPGVRDNRTVKLYRANLGKGRLVISSQVVDELKKGDWSQLVQIVPLSDAHAALIRKVSHQDLEAKKSTEMAYTETMYIGMYSVGGKIRKIQEHEIKESGTRETRTQAFSVRYDARTRRGLLTVPVKPSWVKGSFLGAAHDITFYHFDLNNAEKFKKVFTYSPVDSESKPKVGSLVDWYGSARVAFYRDTDGQSRIIGVSGYAMAEILEDKDGSLLTSQDLELELPEWQVEKIEKDQSEGGLEGGLDGDLEGSPN